jgi:hypothetical protein
MHATNPTSGFSARLKAAGVIAGAACRARRVGINRRKRDNPLLLFTIACLVKRDNACQPLTASSGNRARQFIKSILMRVEIYKHAAKISLLP